MHRERSLWSGFIRSAETFPDRPAVYVEGATFTYRDLRERASRLAATIQMHQSSADTPLTAVFAYRTPTAFSGVLGALLAGNGYVPLNRTFPIERSECKSIIVDTGSAPQLGELLGHSQNSLTILLPDIEDAEPLQAQCWCSAHAAAPIRVG